MSLFFQSDKQLAESLDALPQNYSNDEIIEMVQALQRDMSDTSYLPFDTLAKKVMHYSEAHKKFCLSFPMLFRCIVKGSFTDDMLQVFLANRTKVSSGEITDDDAKKNLIDVGVEIIKANTFKN